MDARRSYSLWPVPGRTERSRTAPWPNLSHWPRHKIEALKAVLKSATGALPLGAFENVRSLPYGHVAAALASLRRLGIASLMAATPSRPGELCIAVVLSRLAGLDSPNGSHVDGRARPAGRRARRPRVLPPWAGRARDGSHVVPREHRCRCPLGIALRGDGGRGVRPRPCESPGHHRRRRAWAVAGVRTPVDPLSTAQRRPARAYFFGLP